MLQQVFNSVRSRLLPSSPRARLPQTLLGTSLDVLETRALLAAGGASPPTLAGEYTILTNGNENQGKLTISEPVDGTADAVFALGIVAEFEITGKVTGNTFDSKFKIKIPGEIFSNKPLKVKGTMTLTLNELTGDLAGTATFKNKITKKATLELVGERTIV